MIEEVKDSRSRNSREGEYTEGEGAERTRQRRILKARRGGKVKEKEDG